MAETIRDVVIRIGLQQVNNQLKAPDTTPFVAAMKLIREQSTAIGADFRTIRDVARESAGSLSGMAAEFATATSQAQSTASAAAMIKSEVERALQAARSADFSPMVTQAEAAASAAASLRSEMDEVAKAGKDAADSFFQSTNAKMSKGNQDNASSFRDLSDAIEEANVSHQRYVEQSSHRIRDEQRTNRAAWNEFSQLQAEAQKQQMARNDAIMKGADSFRAATEGAFMMARGLSFLGAGSEEDLAAIAKQIAHIQGAFDTFRGGIEVVKGVHEATKALSAVQSASAAATAAQTAAQATYTATTGTATVATKAFNAALLANPIVAVTAGITAAGLALAAYTVYLRNATEEQDKNAGLYEKHSERLNKIRQQMKSTQDAFDYKSSQLELEAEKQKLDVLGKQMTIQQQINQIQKQQDESFGLGSIEEWQERRDASSWMGKNQGFHEQTQAAQELVRVLDMQEQAERRKLDLLMKQTDFRKEEAQQAKSILQTVNEQLAAEKQRNQASLVTLGQLSKGQRNRFEDLSERVKSGETLNRGEERWLRGLNISEVQGFFNERDAQRGQKDAGLLDAFTPQKQQRIKSLEQQRDHFKMIEEEVSREADELAEERNRQVRETAERIKQLLDQKGFAQADLKEMEERLGDIVGQIP